MPDSLTTWVVDVRGLTDAYQVGQAEVEILTQKALMVRPLTPRFLVEGDRVELAAIVHNNTSQTQEVAVSLQATGFALDPETEQTQTVTLPTGGSARVAWWGAVGSSAAASLVFRAEAGDLADASASLWGDLEILHYTVPQTFSTSGQLSEAGQRLELVSLPVSIDPTAGALTLELAPSLLATLVAGLDALEEPRFEDTLSRLSRLLANLSAYQMIRDLALESPQLANDLEGLIATDVRQLLDSQNFDGGWSWGPAGAETSSSDPFTTAYVLLGLNEAVSVGFASNEFIYQRGEAYLADHLGNPGNLEEGWQLDLLVFEGYALREADLDLGDRTDGLFARRSELSPWALALLALTISETGQDAGRVNTLLTDLEARAVRSATGVHWESESGSWRLPGTPVFNTAVGVKALAILDPASTSLPMALRYLLAQRDADDQWGSTMETAWALMAVTSALQGTGDYQADYAFQALLNETVIAAGEAAGADTLNAVATTTPITALYVDAPNAVLLERGEGAGTLYYRVDLQTYQLASDAEPVNKGISLFRVYYLSGSACPGAEGCTPLDSLTWEPDDPSQFITAALTLVVPHELYHLVVEDFFPAGTEVLDPSLLTTQTLPENETLIVDSRLPFSEGWGWWVFNDPQIYDDHLTWTAEVVPAGTYILTYRLLPFQRGTFQVLPAHAWQVFFPEVQGTSAGTVFTIE